MSENDKEKLLCGLKHEDVLSELRIKIEKKDEPIKFKLKQHGIFVIISNGTCIQNA